ncbi:MAG: transporter associated domain-containing protein [Peptostreptococcaceae bacterium]
MNILEPEPERTIEQSNFQKLLLLLSNTFAKLENKDYEAKESLNSSDIINSNENLNYKVVREIMTSRKDTYTINIDDDIDIILDSLQKTSYSKIPVYEKHIDNIIGILYVGEILSNINKEDFNNVKIKEFLHRPNCIPEIKRVDELYNSVNENGEKVFILVDEYGGFSGIVTTNDLICEIKDINHEKYLNSSKIRKIDENNYIVKGFLNIDDFNKIFHTSIENGEYDTLSGYIINKLGKIPSKCEGIQLSLGNIILKLVKMSNHRVEDIQVSILN